MTRERRKGEERSRIPGKTLVGPSESGPLSVLFPERPRWHQLSAVAIKKVSRESIQRAVPVRVALHNREYVTGSS
jgi:hypothetical protein